MTMNIFRNPIGIKCNFVPLFFVTNGMGLYNKYANLIKIVVTNNYIVYYIIHIRMNYTIEYSST